MKQNSVCRRTVRVNGENGLHLGPCSQVAQLALTFRSDIHVRKGEQVVNAKSVFDLMLLEAGQGAELDIEASGDDAAEALEKLALLFETHFPSAPPPSVP